MVCVVDGNTYIQHGANAASVRCDLSSSEFVFLRSTVLLEGSVCRVTRLEQSRDVVDRKNKVRRILIANSIEELVPDAMKAPKLREIAFARGSRVKSLNEPVFTASSESFSVPPRVESFSFEFVRNLRALMNLTFQEPSNLTRLATESDGHWPNLHFFTLPAGVTEVSGGLPGSLTSVVVDRASRNFAARTQFILDLTQLSIVSYFGSRRRVWLPAQLKVIGEGAFRRAPLTELLLPPGSQLREIRARALELRHLRELPEFPPCLTKVDGSNLAGLEGDVSDTILNEQGFLFATNAPTTLLRCNRAGAVVVPASFHTLATTASWSGHGHGPGPALPAARTARTVTFGGSQVEARGFADSNLEVVWLTGAQLGTAAFANTPALRTVHLGATDAIPDECFKGSGLRSLSLPATVRRIGKHAFAGCSNLTSVTFENKSRSRLVEIGDGAFNGCPLERLELPESVRVLGERAFANTKLAALDFPTTFTRIGPFAFHKTPLRQVKLPRSVAEIGSGALPPGCHLTLPWLASRPVRQWRAKACNRVLSPLFTLPTLPTEESGCLGR
jgi:hypothetical protein